MGIDLRGRNAGMPKRILDREGIFIIDAHMRGHGVAEIMESDILDTGRGADDDPIPLGPRFGEGLAVLIGKDILRMLWSAVRPLRPVGELHRKRAKSFELPRILRDPHSFKGSPY